VYCRRCGKKINENTHYCRHCGAPTTSEDTLFLTSASSVARRWSKTKIIGITLLIGVIALFLAAFIEGPVIEPLGIGIIEEIAKLIGPIFIALKAPYYLKSKRGTLSLAVVSALTFSFIEDIFYVYFVGASIFERLVILPIHLLWTGIAVFGVSIAVMQSRTDPSMKKNFFKAYLTEGPLILLFIAILLHGAWDGIAFASGELLSLMVGLGFVYTLSVIVLIQAYRHFPEKMITYQYPGAKNLLRNLVGLRSS
jgi:hypothetical protein